VAVVYLRKFTIDQQDLVQPYFSNHYGYPFLQLGKRRMSGVLAPRPPPPLFEYYLTHNGFSYPTSTFPCIYSHNVGLKEGKESQHALSIRPEIFC
jgi:hypothetical protein